MPSYVIYDAATGAIVGHSAGDAPPELPNGFEVLEGPEVDQAAYEVRSGQVVARDVASSPPAAPRLLSFNEWVDRFTFEAQAGIMAATVTDPMAKLIYDRAMSAGITGAIDPTDPRTAQGVQYLVAKGYITQADAEGALVP